MRRLAGPERRFLRHLKSLCSHAQDPAHALESRMVTAELGTLGHDFVQFELAGRSETAALIGTCHACHFSFGFQHQILQGTPC